MSEKTEDPYESSRFTLNDVIDLAKRLTLHPTPGEQKITTEVTFCNFPGSPIRRIKNGKYFVHEINFSVDVKKLENLVFPNIIAGKLIQSNELQEPIGKLINRDGVYSNIESVVNDAIIVLEIEGKQTSINYKYCTKIRG